MSATANKKKNLGEYFDEVYGYKGRGRPTKALKSGGKAAFIKKHEGKRTFCVIWYTGIPEKKLSRKAASDRYVWMMDPNRKYGESGDPNLKKGTPSKKLNRSKTRVLGVGLKDSYLDVTKSDYPTYAVCQPTISGHSNVIGRYTKGFSDAAKKAGGRLMNMLNKKKKNKLTSIEVVIRETTAGSDKDIKGFKVKFSGSTVVKIDDNTSFTKKKKTATRDINKAGVDKIVLKYVTAIEKFKFVNPQYLALMKKLAIATKADRLKAMKESEPVKLKPKPAPKPKPAAAKGDDKQAADILEKIRMAAKEREKEDKKVPVRKQPSRAAKKQPVAPKPTTAPANPTPNAGPRRGPDRNAKKPVNFKGM